MTGPTVYGPVGAPLPSLVWPTETGRCPMCGWTEEFPAEIPPWKMLNAVPAQCEWDGTLMERIERMEKP